MGRDVFQQLKCVTLICTTVFPLADHWPQGRLAGVQFSPGCRWPLYLHSGGTRTEPVLQRCQEPTAAPAAGEGKKSAAKVKSV